MEAWLVAAAVVVAVYLLLQLFTRGSQGKEQGLFPPGPFAWPIIGHLPLVRTGNPRVKLMELSRKHGYGPIIGLRLGARPAVVVSTAELAKELLATNDKIFANRPPFQFTDTLFYGYDSAVIFSSYGPHLTRLRKLYTLRLFTVKRLQQLQYIRQEELRRMLQDVRRAGLSKPPQAVNMEHLVSEMSCNVTARLLHSRTLEKEFPHLSDLIRELEHAAKPTPGDFIPWLRWMGRLQKAKVKGLHDRLDYVCEYILSERKQLMKTTPSHELPDDFVQALLSKEASNDDEELLTMPEIKGIILDIFSGGLHTSSVTVEWAMSELIKNPKCMRKLREEIDTVLSAGKCQQEQVTDDDLDKLPYLEAVVKEVFRLHPVVPLLLPRLSSEACQVGKYTLPRKTQAFVNAWAIGRDPDVWEDAETFCLDRFEGSKMDVKGQNFELLPFGAGRRICPGMRLGLSVVHVTLANLVKFFEWELPDSKPCTSLDMSEMKGRSSRKGACLLVIPRARILS